MANALEMKQREDLESTVEFIRKFNDAFDVLNIRYKSEGVKTKNERKMLITKTDDWRFEVWVRR